MATVLAHPSSATYFEGVQVPAHEVVLMSKDGVLLEQLREGLHVGGRYSIERFLGAGGSGRAFLAQDTRLQRRVVLKEVRDLGEDKYRPAPLLRKMVQGGLLGKKSGRGFYDYAADKAPALK